MNFTFSAIIYKLRDCCLFTIVLIQSYLKKLQKFDEAEFLDNLQDGMMMLNMCGK